MQFSFGLECMTIVAKCFTTKTFPQKPSKSIRKYVTQSYQFIERLWLLYLYNKTKTLEEQLKLHSCLAPIVFM